MKLGEIGCFLSHYAIWQEVSVFLIFYNHYFIDETYLQNACIIKNILIKTYSYLHLAPKW